ncbi:MAG: hypothetical protein EA385_01025 [Salinarimonadaceae bacterium]|nr:MAG: hypothetical protein EA385_01025 [Salinarimonadaceae bacterium]
MIDDIAILDDETRPRAPKIAGATDAHRAHGRRLRLFHHAHIHQLAQLRRVIEALARGEGDEAEVAARASSLAMAENYRRFGALCGHECQMLTLHHMIEDQEIFPRLAASGSEGLRKVVARLAKEHETVHALLVRLEEAAVALLRAPAPERVEAVRVVFEALERVVLSHFGYEERELEEALGYHGVAL